MSETFYIRFTDVGVAKEADYIANSNKYEITQIAVGDSNGSYYDPDGTETALVNEVWRGNINNIFVDPNNDDQFIVECVVPDDAGPFWIKEVGIFDSVGDMIAIGKYPERYKPETLDGAVSSIYIKAIFKVSVASAVDITVNPSAVMATEVFAEAEVSDHNIDPAAHVALFAQKADDEHEHPELQSQIDGKAALNGSSLQLFSVANAISANNAVNLSQLQAVKPDIYVPYAVNSGSRSTSGYANFLEKLSDTQISFNSSAPIVCTYPDGSIESNTGLPALTIISDGAYKIVKEKGQNPVATQRVITEDIVAPVAPENGDYWLDIGVIPYIPYKYNGASWVVTQFVKMGEVQKITGVIQPPITYAYNGRYDSGIFTVSSSPVIKSANLGVHPSNQVITGQLARGGQTKWVNISGSDRSETYHFGANLASAGNNEIILAWTNSGPLPSYAYNQGVVDESSGTIYCRLKARRAF